MEFKAMTVAECNKAIDSIKNRGQKLDASIHDAACSALHNVISHNNPALCNRLLDAMPKSGRKNALCAWMLRFGNVALNEAKETKKDSPLVYMKDKESNLAEAIKTPFWELKALEGAGTSFAMEAFLASVSKRFATALKEVTDPVQRAALENVMASLAAVPKDTIVAAAVPDMALPA
jgi:hypothetical protein